MDKILLIDDREKMREDVLTQLNLALNEAGLTEVCSVATVTINDQDLYFKVSNPSSQAPEDKLTTYFEEHPEIKLIVVDHDLSLFDRGDVITYFTEPVVATASHAASIPQCRYARKELTEFTILADAVESSTVFSVRMNVKGEKLNSSAKEMIEIYAGFKNLHDELTKLDLSMSGTSPSLLLAQILRAEEYQSDFERYTFSTTFLREILELYSSKEKLGDNFANIRNKRFGYLLGYWLYNSILQFPGIILNKTATFSYLNIHADDFEKYKPAFESAKYNGPFSLFSEYWWKPKLDQLLQENNVWTGLELLQAQGHTVASCKCSVNPEKDAGYYCIITHQPISADESMGHLSWLPDGATLCRVSTEPYETVAPLLGLY